MAAIVSTLSIIPQSTKFKLPFDGSNVYRERKKEAIVRACGCAIQDHFHQLALCGSVRYHSIRIKYSIMHSPVENKGDSSVFTVPETNEVSFQ